jgi:beta-phosphoglucomutase
MRIQAVIFDLDGVIVSTDEYHYQAWRALADRLGIPFSRHDNERLRGVSRMESLEIILEKWTGAPFSEDEKERMAGEKNEIYRNSLSRLSLADILPGVETTLDELEQRGIQTAIGSSSKNAATILKAIGLEGRFDVVVDGTHISRSKPDPEVFLLAAKLLGLKPADCLVVEDADAGVEAAVAAKMSVLAVGPAAHHRAATLTAEDLASIAADDLLDLKVCRSC